MKEQLHKIKQRGLEDLEKISNMKQMRSFEVKYFGRKGELSQVMRRIKDLPKNERPALGKLANEVKQALNIARSKAEKSLTSKQREVSVIDLTWPSQPHRLGHLHPLTQFLDKVMNIFTSMGFEVLEGQEVETPEYNFDLLNIPKNHPSRDAWDTFYVEGGMLMRTHTSPVQLRAMKKKRPPVRLIAPGRVFRHEATDAGHETTFYQCEGLVIDRSITVSNLISTLEQFLKEVYGSKVKIRVRPEYYPFVEPGMDVDMQCLICDGQGCSVCHQRGWLEMLGSGMIHPKVLSNMNIDPEKFSGFAFGLGIDRLMMLYHGINDVRLSYSGDLRFLEQF